MCRHIAFYLILFSAFIASSVAQNSCAGRCGDTDASQYYCFCDADCNNYGDCCADYEAECVGVTDIMNSCKGKCDTVGTYSSWACQCNTPCVKYGDCCDDYAEECSSVSSPGVVTDAELANIAEEMLALEEVNNAAAYIEIDLQAQTTKGSAADLAKGPLLHVQPAAYEKHTIQLLINLYKYYIAEVNEDEIISPGELEEVKAFVDAIINTPVFQAAKMFLISKGFLSEANFRSTIEEIWFGQYSRASGYYGSSGFEHVFLGELKKGVSGFHNWIRFSLEETNGNLNYHGYLQFLNFGSKGSFVGHNFEWLQNQKPISSMFIGTSPELEMGIFTICWYTRPNGICHVRLNGNDFKITTYDISNNGKKYIATSYADC